MATRTVIVVLLVVVGISLVCAQSKPSWTFNQPVAIYESVGLANHAANAISGYGFNGGPTHGGDVRKIQDGSLVYNVTGTDVTLATARKAGVVAVHDVNKSGATVAGYTVDSSTAAWTVQKSGTVFSAEVNSVAIDDHATIIAALYGMNNATLMEFYDAKTGATQGNFTTPSGLFPIDIEVSADGHYIGFVASGTIFVYDTHIHDLLFNISTGFSSPCFCMSGNGEFLAYGFETVSFFQRNASEHYNIVWSNQVPDFTASTCAFSQSHTLAIGYRRNDLLQNRYDMHHSISATPSWTYLGNASAPGFQDQPVASRMTRNGNFVAFANWGNKDNTSPQVLGFSFGHNSTVLSYVTPGSMMAIDIEEAQGGRTVILAGGKHVHANAFGDGGDLFAFAI